MLPLLLLLLDDEPKATSDSTLSTSMQTMVYQVNVLIELIAKMGLGELGLKMDKIIEILESNPGVLKTTTTSTTTQATESTCADGMYSLDDCTGFYHCAHGHRYPNQHCPGDLLFNGQVCDWPDNVNCGGVPETSEETTEAPAQPCAGRPCSNSPCVAGIFRDEVACDQFYQCANGHRFPNQLCPAGLMFNGQVCDWPENVDCSQQSAPNESSIIQTLQISMN